MKKLLIILLLLSTTAFAYDAYLPTGISYIKYNEILQLGANKTRMYHECVNRTKDEKYCYKTIKNLDKINKEVEDARKISK